MKDGPALPPSAAHPAGPDRSCALTLSPAGNDEWALGVEIFNRTDAPMEARYFYPLIFALEAWAGSKRVEVQIPAWDSPVEPRTISVPGGERVEIPTPVTLRFAPDREPRSDSPFEWLLISPPTHVTLHGLRVFPDWPDLTCTLEFNAG